MSNPKYAPVRIKVTTDGTTHNTRIWNADTGDAITNITSITFSFDVREPVGKAVVTYFALPVSAAELTAVPVEYQVANLAVESSLSLEMDVLLMPTSTDGDAVNYDILPLYFKPES